MEGLAMSETNGSKADEAPVTPLVITPKTRDAFLLAVHNSTQQLKRGLLDFLDFQEETLMNDPGLAAIHDRIKHVFGYTKKRVHNDVSAQRDQILACFRIYESGGIIPAFGRSKEERDASPPRSGH
jgi:hypothetical protein